MVNLHQRFLNKDTFYISFKKVKAFLEQGNEWYDPIELLAYEADLGNNLGRLIAEISQHEYTPRPLQPIPYPKKTKSGKTKLRQFFRVHLDDQIVWTAILIVLGPGLDERMPFWSYGHRLYRPIWFEEEGGKLLLKKGHLWNSSDSLYRRWNQSWPLFRRHVSMTIAVMGAGWKFKTDSLSSEIEVQTYNQEKENNFDCQYLKPKFWSSNKVSQVYWAGLDFKAFYPNMNSLAIIQNFVNVFTDPFNDRILPDAVELIDLVKKMFSYPLDLSGWEQTEHLTSGDGLNLKGLTEFDGIPTGLLAGGFLANVGMLAIDTKIDQYIRKQSSVAIFKYVDDHIILSKSNEELLEFINFYNTIVKDSETNIEFEWNKTLPSDTLNYSEKKVSFHKDAEENNAVDVQYPKPLMTQTQQKMSELNSEEYDLADESDLAKSVADLEHFLLTDFPDEEMKKDTRLSFAAMKLSQLASQITPNFRTLQSVMHQISESKNKRVKSSKNETGHFDGSKVFYDELTRQSVKARKKQRKILDLILKAVEENPDKLKLWRRAVDVCFIAGFDTCAVTDFLKRANLHPLSKDYVSAFITSKIAEALLSCNNVLMADCPSFWKTLGATEFINNCFKVSPLETVSDNFPFSKLSIEHYQLVLDFIKTQEYPKLSFTPPLIQNQTKTSVHGSPRKVMHSREERVWFLLDNVNYQQRSAIWKSAANKLDLSNPISWSILSVFSTQIDQDLFTKMTVIKAQPNFPTEYYDLTSDAQGMLYDLFGSNHLLKKRELNKYPKIKATVNHAEKLQLLSLDKWLSFVVEQTKGNSWIDIRLAEWTFLEIIRQIAKALQKKLFTGGFIYKVHPANYLVPASWCNQDSKTLTWQQWENVTTKEPITLANGNYFIDDFRYIPIRDLWRSDKTLVQGNQFSIVIGLSVLLTKLFAKSFTWPSTTNKLSFIDKLFTAATSAIENQPISSDTRALLNQVFSRKDIGFMSGFHLIDGHQDVKSLTTFIERIQEIQQILKQHHLTMVNHAPRQLTMIDIDKLNEAKSII